MFQLPDLCEVFWKEACVHLQLNSPKRRNMPCKGQIKLHSGIRGFLIKVYIDTSLDEPFCKLDIFRSSRWDTISTREITEYRLCLILIGHGYAKKATKFDVGESLDILGLEYLKGGFQAVRAAIGGGIFSLFVIDYQKSRLGVITDLLSCMPVYFRRHKQGINIGTSEFDLGGDVIEPYACFEYLRYGHLMLAPAFHRGIERIGPGQSLEVDLNDGSMAELVPEIYPTYPAPAERIQSLDEACRMIDQSLSRYFDRLSNERLAAGLSGGYDSRLIAAYTKRHDLSLVTFDNPGTNETAYAQLVAKYLDISTKVVKISADSPSRLVEDFVFGMQSMDNLECSHVFALLEALLEESPEYLIDGLLGDTAIGCGFFYKLHSQYNPVWKTVFLRDRYDLGIDPAYDWVDHMRRHHPRRLPDEALHGLACSEEDPFRETAAMVNAAIRKACHTHFDGIDMINYRARTSRVFACGPVTFLRKCPTLCPFYDIDVLTTCMSIDTSLRAGERLYNALWRYRFPEYISIPKESTGGRPSQSDMNYRLSHLSKAMSRRLANRLYGMRGGMAKAGGDLEDFLSMYMLNSRNLSSFDDYRSKESINRLIPYDLNVILDEITPRNDNRIYMRAISLATLFNPPKYFLEG
jgi:hypothetical protein